MNTPFISICVPAYQKPDSLKRLLESIFIQSFQDYEIIVTDDSIDDAVKILVASLQPAHSIRYYHHNPARGMPANWNAALQQATGQWIKIMHDDDWFRHPDALQAFADATPGNQVIFSAFCNIAMDQQPQPHRITSRKVASIIQLPYLLIANNLIGPPSTLMVHHSVSQFYDTRFRWRVDVEMYIRLLANTKKVHYIPRPLVNIGIHDTQITQSTKNNPVYELPEMLLLLQLYGTAMLKNLRVYDTVWRMFRNTGTRNTEQLAAYTPEQDWPPVLIHMLMHLQKVPVSLLQSGAVSKSAMLLSYLSNYNRLTSFSTPKN